MLISPTKVGDGLVVIGLSPDNIKGLKRRQPVMVARSESGLDVDILIFAGNTDDADGLKVEAEQMLHG